MLKPEGYKPLKDLMPEITVQYEKLLDALKGLQENECLPDTVSLPE